MDPYYEKNREAILEKRRLHYLKNRSNIRLQQQTYYQRKKNINYIFKIVHL